MLEPISGQLVPRSVVWFVLAFASPEYFERLSKTIFDLSSLICSKRLIYPGVGDRVENLAGSNKNNILDASEGYVDCVTTSASMCVEEGPVENTKSVRLNETSDSTFVVAFIFMFFPI